MATAFSDRQSTRRVMPHTRNTGGNETFVAASPQLWNSTVLLMTRHQLWTAETAIKNISLWELTHRSRSRVLAYFHVRIRTTLTLLTCFCASLSQFVTNLQSVCVVQYLRTTLPTGRGCLIPGRASSSPISFQHFWTGSQSFRLVHCLKHGTELCPRFQLDV